MALTELEHALALIEKLVGMSEALADAIEVMASHLPTPADPSAMRTDLEGLMTATLTATNAARQFVAVVRETE